MKPAHLQVPSYMRGWVYCSTEDKMQLVSLHAEVKVDCINAKEMEWSGMYLARVNLLACKDLWALDMVRSKSWRGTN